MNRVVVVSNRVPVPVEGETRAGGLSVALEGMMVRQGGLWFGWSGKVSEAAAGEPTLCRNGELRYATFDLSAEQHQRYYNDFSNGVLWPLLHSMPGMMQVDRRGAAEYRAVNQHFAKLLMPMLRPNDLVWVHDYHLMALPRLLRAQGVRAPIGFFLHIPFPAPDMLAAAPDAALLVRDLLASDLIGFQTAGDLENFSQAAMQLAGAARPARDLLALDGRRIRLGVFPAEIEARDFAAVAERAWRSPANERLRRSLAGQQLVLGVDRLDPTKGIPQRLAGFRRYLETRPEARGRVTLLQIAALSRGTVSAYQDLRDAVEHDAGALNADFGEADWMPLRVVARAGARETVAGYMREARVGLVTPLRDGMNLVAKEYVAAQNPLDPGVLVLSRFAGAIHQFPSALPVNPHDPDEIADAIAQSLSMPLAERRSRWRGCWAAIADRSGPTWGQDFLAALIQAQAGPPRFSASFTPLAADPIALSRARPVPSRRRMPDAEQPKRH